MGTVHWISRCQQHWCWRYWSTLHFGRSRFDVLSISTASGFSKLPWLKSTKSSGFVSILARECPLTFKLSAALILEILSVDSVVGDKSFTQKKRIIIGLSWILSMCCCHWQHMILMSVQFKESCQYCLIRRLASYWWNHLVFKMSHHTTLMIFCSQITMAKTKSDKNNTKEKIAKNVKGNLKLNPVKILIHPVSTNYILKILILPETFGKRETSCHSKISKEK